MLLLVTVIVWSHMYAFLNTSKSTQSYVKNDAALRRNLYEHTTLMNTSTRFILLGATSWNISEMLMHFRFRSLCTLWYRHHILYINRNSWLRENPQERDSLMTKFDMLLRCGQVDYCADAVNTNPPIGFQQPGHVTNHYHHPTTIDREPILFLLHGNSKW